MVETTFWDKMGTKRFRFAILLIILIELAIFYMFGHITMAVSDSLFKVPECFKYKQWVSIFSIYEIMVFMC